MLPAEKSKEITIVIELDFASISPKRTKMATRALKKSSLDSKHFCSDEFLNYELHKTYS